MKKDQKGFTAVEVVIVLVVVALLAAVGWYVYRANNKKDDDKKATSQTNNSSTNETTPTTDEKKTASYFSVKEWGVKAEYAGSQGLTYKLVNNNKSALFSSDELINQDPACSATNGAGGSITRYVDSDKWWPAGDGPTVEESAKTDASFTKVGSYYYYFAHSQSGCGDNETAIDKNQALQQQVNDLVKGLVPKLIAE